MHFDHAGIATDDAQALAELYGDLFGLEVAHEEEFDGMRVVFLDCGNGYFELLEPLEDDSTIARYLEDGGAGIHHLALATDDIEAALETARDHDVTLIDEEPRPGAWSHSVAFLHPKDTGGILVEFVEH
ncbi:methylmalonyl-CoA epimerase [Haloterrigena sp. H1]|uniref:methylmalonyl-CoA epimerase n=1 Tax=Haloterrigena sp. H1 TaxID=2552943 RepID=UPI00110DE481|nr:methylmalonyl-CoA epimerase [Haloterrigena sp. H1]TMT79170.1 methylmalonyl-CoA epimerase [Haloterrigena sp. H1]TMT86646.1 methylmalonyl-CoA epimerase [Haloterrigena sp. H1]